MVTLLGCDVSSWQGAGVNWPLVAAQGATFAFCKASEGSWYADPTLPRNWAETRKLGLLRGAYHFGRPDRGTDPLAEADFFLAQIGHSLEPSDHVVLDIEVGSGDLSAWCLVWLRHVAQAVGFKPVVYTGGWFAPGRLVDPALGDYPLWNSAYVALCPPAYAPWSLVSCWQFSENYAWDGIGGRCDASYFFGDRAQWATLGKPGAPPAPPAALPVGPLYKVAVPYGRDMYLRLAPRLDAAHSDLVSNGEFLDATTALSPATTTHWRAVKRRATGKLGYALASNLVLP